MLIFKKLFAFNVHGYNYGGYNEALLPVGFGLTLCILGLILWIDAIRNAPDSTKVEH